MSAFSGLSNHDLNTLATALRSGRLARPFDVAQLQRLFDHSSALLTLEALEKYHEHAFTEEQLAAMIELLMADRKQRKYAEDVIDLVVTGPTGPGIANRDTKVVVRELFANANRSVLIAGYAIYQGRTVFKALADRMKDVPELEVKMFLDISRKLEENSNASLLVHRFAHRFKNKQWPQDHPLPHVYYDPRSLDQIAFKKSALHAKCIVVDDQHLFVSSANFTEAAQLRNIEVGLLIHSRSVAKKLSMHFHALIANRILLPAW
jgi:phosphatidylserine/phosphatidylglycerophosphate/cardiolipin synthase-like enzyme